MNSHASTLLEKLSTTRPTDRSGATAANRFQFQLSWAICRLLELHPTSSSYALVLDYHDDVLELDHESTPSKIDFHQIKSKKNGNWTVKRLLKRESGKPDLKPSILGKLTRHRAVFGDHTRLTCFVSNRPSNLPLENGANPDDIERFSLMHTDVSTRDQIVEALENECNMTLDSVMIGNLFFIKTPLNSDDHENQTRGRLATFLETYVDPDAPTNPVYKSLRAELLRRNNDERLATNKEDLSRQKLFGRSHMEQILALVRPRKSIHDLLNEITANLARESTPFTKRQSLRKRCERIFAERLDPTNSLLLSTATQINYLYTKWITSPNNTGTLQDGLSIVKHQINQELYSAFVDAYQEEHFDALYLVTCHDFTAFSSSTAEPPEETP